MFAAAGGHKEVAELLIGEKAEVNAKVKATSEYKEQVGATLRNDILFCNQFKA